VPRRRTTDHPGAFHHVMVRGSGRHDIFCDDDDRVAYCDRLSLVFLDDGARCLAWALMPNHVHLVVRTGARPLARVMHRLGTRYSRYFNDRHGRFGHLLQGRYRAIRVASDAQLATLVRYVHANPVRAGLVASIEELARYRWTGHAALIGHAAAALFHDTGAALQLFDERIGMARASLLELMSGLDESRAMERDPHAIDVEVLAPPPHALPPLDSENAMELVITRVCHAQGVRERELREGSRRRPVSRARATIAYLALHELGVPVAATARLLGVSRQTLWLRLENGRRAASMLPPIAATS